MTDVRPLNDPAAAAAERLAAAVRPGAHIVLTGGSTPKDTYERLAAMNVDWSGCSVWFSDERCVPPDDERSNFGMARDALLDRIDGPAPRVLRIAGERGPHVAADAYDRELREAFGDQSPRFDLVLLGLGRDAHCASLFPDQSALDERERFAVGVETPGLDPWVPRVTLTLPAINAATEVLFLVTGADKAAAIERAFGRAPDRGAPASLVAPASGTVTVLADAAAAHLLPVTRPR